MVVPPQLAGFTAIERVAIQRARQLHRLMGEYGLDTLEATLELEDPPGGGLRLRCEIQIAYGLASMRILHTRLELAVEDLHRPDLLDEADGGAFLPRRAGEPAVNAAGAPVSEGARSSSTQADPHAGGEGPAT